jgi:hypothetical protein
MPVTQPGEQRGLKPDDGGTGTPSVLTIADRLWDLAQRETAPTLWAASVPSRGGSDMGLALDRWQDDGGQG